MIQKLHLLWELFDEVYVSQSVIRELTTSSNEHDHGRQEILQAIHEKKIQPYTIKDELLVKRLFGKLHLGELETIVGGIELGVDFVLIDEISARNMAKNFFQTPIGTIGILRLAKSKGKIEYIKHYLDVLILNDYRIGKKLYEQVLKIENEWTQFTN